MITIDIPGHNALNLSHLVLDYNGTIAIDGTLIPGVAETLNHLGKMISIHVVTADTFGSAAANLENITAELVQLPEGNQDIAKRDFIRKLNPSHTAAIGNGRNDQLMLKEAVLGIAVILGEGAFSKTVMDADVICTDILSGLSLLSHPKRLMATLRS